MLLNVLNVPKNNSHHVADIRRFKECIQRNATMILPVTTIIETGNTIAKADHALHASFIKMLKAIADGQTPWVATTLQMDAGFLQRLIGGDGHLAGLAALMQAKVGTGDATILHEVLAYRRRVPTGTSIEVWTHDQQLQGQASVVTS
ncbi:MAG: hypothetical protein ACR2LE_01780 [Nocardioidaceae bacterium]